MRGLSFPSKQDKEFHGSHHGSQYGGASVASGGHSSVASKLMKKVSSTIKTAHFRSKKSSTPSPISVLETPVMSRRDSIMVGNPILHTKENPNGRAMTFSVGSAADQPLDPTNVERDIPFFGHSRKNVTQPEKPGVTVVRGKPAWHATRAARAYSTVSAAASSGADPYAAARSSLPPTPTSPVAPIKPQESRKPPRVPVQPPIVEQVERKITPINIGSTEIPRTPSLTEGSITSPILPDTPTSARFEDRSASQHSLQSALASPTIGTPGSSRRIVNPAISPMSTVLPPTVATVCQKQGPIPSVMTRRAHTTHAAPGYGQRQPVLREIHNNVGSTNMQKELSRAGGSAYHRQLCDALDTSKGRSIKSRKSAGSGGWVHRTHDQHTTRERRPRAGKSAGSPMIVDTGLITHPCHKSEISVLIRCAEELKIADDHAKHLIEQFKASNGYNGQGSHNDSQYTQDGLVTGFEKYRESVDTVFKMLLKRSRALENLYKSSENYSKAFSVVYNLDEDTSARLLRECEAELDQENLDPVSSLR